MEKLNNHLSSYQSFHEKIGNQLGTVVNTYNLSNKEFKKIDKDVLKVSGKGGNLELDDLEKPKLDTD